MASFVKVTKVDELPPGERIVIEVDEHFIAVFNIGGQFYAIADLCTHDDGPLADGEVRGHIIECPRHSATFDLRNGAALTSPAVKPVPSYMVKVQGNDVLVNIE